MRPEETPGRAGHTRRTVLIAGGTMLAALGASGGILAASAAPRPRPAPTAVPTPTPTPAATATTPPPPPPPPPPPLVNPPVPGVELHPAHTSTLQGVVQVPETGEWFTTQMSAGTSALLDAAALEVGDIVISRLTAEGALVDSMTLPDAGHGMGLVVRIEAGVPVVTTCWFAPGPGGTSYDLVRLPYAPGTAARSAATTVVPGAGYPVDPSYDASTDSVTLRHQGGGPQYTRHRWADLVAGNLTQPTGAIATPDSPPTHQGFCSRGDRFFFYTGAPTDLIGGDPVLITEYSWATGQVVGPPLDASGNARLPDGTYPGGRMEPEGATIVVDGAGAASLLVGVTTGGRSVPRTYPTFRYPLPPA